MGMRALQRCTLVLCLCVAITGFAGADEAPKVTLEASEVPANQVAAQIAGQIEGVSVLATKETTDPVTLSLQGVTLEEAVEAVANEVNGNFVRGYILERKGPGEKDYTAEQYIEFLKATRDYFREGLSEEQRRIFRERTQEYLGREAGRQMGRFMGPENTGRPLPDPFGYDYPLAELVMMPRIEEISLQLADTPILEALEAFTFESGYLVILEEGIEADITLQAENAPLAEVLDEIAAAAEAQWRMLYIIAQPVQLAAAEVEQRMDQAFSQGWSRFWENSPEERQRLIQRALTAMQMVPPEFVKRATSHPRARGMFSRLLNANAALTPEQRQEIRPLVQEIAKIMGQ